MVFSYILVMRHNDVLSFLSDYFQTNLSGFLYVIYVYSQCKSTLCLTKQHDMQTYGRVEI